MGYFKLYTKLVFYLYIWVISFIPYFIGVHELLSDNKRLIPNKSKNK
jgi:hypothetical protein